VVRLASLSILLSFLALLATEWLSGPRGTVR
jgi:hypothetical protein